jgi:hypothetical protein
MDNWFPVQGIQYSLYGAILRGYCSQTFSRELSNGYT